MLCSVGLVHYKDGLIAEGYDSLIMIGNAQPQDFAEIVVGGVKGAIRPAHRRTLPDAAKRAWAAVK